MLKSVVRAIAIVTLVVVVLYVALLAAIHFGRNKLLFPGAGLPAQPVNPSATFPNAEDVKIPVDGATFAHAWWIPAQSGTARTLLWFHGNGYALEDELKEEIPALYWNRVNLLLVDYRGYGASSPIKTTAETTAADARAAFRYLTDEKHLAPANIWIAGRSMGAAVAVRLAAETPNAAGLILITPTSNTADVEPYRRLIRPLAWFGLTKEFDSVARMPQIQMPVTIIAGARDTIAPPWMAKALLRAANAPKTIRIIDRAGHNDIFSEDQNHLVLWQMDEAMRPRETHAAPGSKPTPAALVVREYLALVEKGGLLSPEGWQKASAFFTSAKPYPENSRIVVIDEVVAVDEYAANHTIAAVGSNWNDSFGYMDDDLIVHPYDEYFGSILTGTDYLVEWSERRLALDQRGQIQAESTVQPGWKIAGPLETRKAPAKQVVEYLERVRDTTKDPHWRQAAEEAIRQIKRFSVNCAC